MLGPSPSVLPLTGERTVPGIERENYWFRRHEAVYRWIGHQNFSGPVLEAGCGEGYGASYLADRLNCPVLAIDYDEASCRHARSVYAEPHVVRANLAALPVTPQRFGLAVSLQVIEHLWDLAGFLRQVTAALRPGGALVVSTPNRLTFSPGLGRGERPTNPFHVEEFDPLQMQAMMATAGFHDVRVYGLAHASRLVAEDAAHGDVVAAQVNAILTDTWSDELLRRVSAVTTADFVIGAADDSALDLIAVGVAASGIAS